MSENEIIAVVNEQEDDSAVDYVSIDNLDEVIASDEILDQNLDGYDERRPLWEVWLNGQYEEGELLHTTAIDNTERGIISPSLDLALNEAGTFSFTILPNHPLYSSLVPMSTTVTIYSQGVELFRGRVKDFTTDIYRQRSVNCEGDLGYLGDVLFKIYGGKKKTVTLQTFFKDIIRAYNNGASDGRKFSGSETTNLANLVAASKQKNKITIEEESYQTAISYIDNMISTYGGYVRTKRTKNGVDVEYLESYTATSDQVLTYGGTIQSMSIANNPSDICTVLIPEGDNPDAGTKDSKSDHITISSVKNSSIGGFSHKKGQDTLIWDEGVKKYGRIMKTQSFSGITTPASLISRARLYMQEMVKSLKGDISIKALDMHLLNGKYRPIYLGERVRVVSELHGVDEMLTCMAIRYDMTSPENTEYTFDVPYHFPNGSFSKQYKKNKQTTDATTQKNSRKAGKAASSAAGAQSSADSALSKISSLSEQIGDLSKVVNTGKVVTPELVLGSTHLTKNSWGTVVTDVSVWLDGDNKKVKAEDGSIIKIPCTKNGTEYYMSVDSEVKTRQSLLK